MVFQAIPAIAGALLASRGAFAISGLSSVASRFARSPIIQGGSFGVGYTGGAYAGYGISNTYDPLGIHKPKYSTVSSKLGLPYGSYGRRRYSRGYSGYSRYSRRPYYRRRRYGYRRRSYYRRSYY